MRDSNLRHFDGPRLQLARESAGLSRYDLATKVGVSECQVWRWEVGRARPRKSYVSKLAKLLEVGKDELIGVEATA